MDEKVEAEPKIALAKYELSFSKIHLNLGQYKFNAHLYSHESESESDVTSDGFIENPF